MNEIFFFYSHERKRERETATDSDRVQMDDIEQGTYKQRDRERENRAQRIVFRQRVKSQGSRSFVETT